MARRGHTVTFYEKAVPYYASTRDGWSLPSGVQLRLYGAFEEVCAEAEADLDNADLAMSTSYCPDGTAAAQLLFDSKATIKAFYDLDAPVTLSTYRSGQQVPYLPPQGLRDFDLALSYTGGRTMSELQSCLGARMVAALYGSVDPETYRPVPAVDEYRSALSYLGTYAKDRQAALHELFIGPAQALPDTKFLLAGAQYPEDFPWRPNIYFVRHLPSDLHASCLCSGRATLNVTRRTMAEFGFCPSGRLFEAAACGTAILSDWWEGLDHFFTPGLEFVRVDTTRDVLDALQLSDLELHRIGMAARARTLEQHTADARVLELESICDAVLASETRYTLAAHQGVS
jgi:spore maturation protein CgeB